MNTEKTLLGELIKGLTRDSPVFFRMTRAVQESRRHRPGGVDHVLLFGSD